MNRVDWKRAAALLCVAWASALQACASTRSAPQNIPVNESAMDPPKPGVRVPKAGSMREPATQVRLNPNQLILPEAPEGASTTMQEFVTAASHAVAQAYQADNDDPSVILALQESLRTNSELSPLVNPWRDILQSAMARTESLQAVGPVLRPLRDALRAATFEPSSETLQGMDVQHCQSIFASPIGRNTAIDGIVATFTNIGTYTLGQVREACATSASASASLAQARLPGQPAPAKIARLVRRLFDNAHLGGEVRKVAVLSPWHKDRIKHVMAMRAAVGISQPAADEDNGQGSPCTMARVSVVRSLRHNAQPALTELGNRHPILCSQLR